MQNDPPVTRLDREATARLLTDAGYPLKPCSLAAYAHRGCGPEFVIFGKRALYNPETVLSWAESRCQSSHTRAA